MGLVRCGVEDERRETRDVGRCVVRRRIDLGDHDTGRASEVLAQLLVLGRQRFAVTAPRCIEFHEHILAGVQDDAIEAGADHHLDGPTVVLGLRLRFDIGHQTTRQVILHPLADGVSRRRLLFREEVILLARAILNAQTGRLAAQTKVLGVVDISDTVEFDEAQLSLVILGDRRECPQRPHPTSWRRSRQTTSRN